MYFTFAEYQSSQKHIENFQFIVFNDTDHISRFNFTGKLLVTLRRMLVTFDVKRKSNETLKKYDVDILHSNVDTCNVAKGIIGNYVIKFILSGLEKYSNFRFECPQQKGYYYINNFPLPKSLQEYLPSFISIPGKNTQWQITISTKAKVQKAAAVRVLHIQLSGVTILSD